MRAIESYERAGRAAYTHKVSAMVAQSQADLVERIATKRGVTVSTVVRMALDRIIEDDRKDRL